MFSSGYESSVSGAVASLPAEAAHAVSESPAAGLQVAGQLGQAGQGLAQTVKDSFMNGMSNSLITGAIVLGVAVSLILWLAPRRPRVNATAEEVVEADIDAELEELLALESR